MSDARLAAKVKAVNRANAYAAQLQAKMVEIFRPSIGQQILKKDGSLLAKIEKLLPELPHIGAPSHGGGDISVYRINSDYRVEFSIKVQAECGNDGPYTKYITHQTSAFVGTVEKGVLTEVADPAAFTGQWYRTDFTAEEIQQKRDAVATAEAALTQAKSALGPFSQNDY